MNPLVYAKLAAALALGAALAYGCYHVADLKGKAAVASLQHAWDVDKASIQKVTDDAIAKATQERDTALQANEVISNDYQSQLSSARALSLSLAQQLRSYASRATNSGAVPKAGGGQGTAPTSSQSGDVVLTNALGAALAECSANAAQLDALIVELKPQL
jgi:hypothetical protein